MDAYFDKNPSDQPLEQRLDEMAQMAGMVLEESYTRDEIASILDLPVDRLVEKYMTKFPIHAEKFLLRERALHVFCEASRVTLMYELLAESSAEDKPSEDILFKVGELMNVSQKSCRELFDCSCKELDELCQLAQGAGSYGSRLTGAGWGGCSVHLVPKDKAQAVKKVWREEYYAKLEGLSEEQLEGAVVESKPGAGAVLFRVHPEVTEV